MEEYGVFSRNHFEYLESALKIHSLDPNQFITFRASKLWDSAIKLLSKNGILKIFYAPIDGKKLIEYEAIIHYIKLNPDMRDPETKKYLSFALPETKKEDLWNGKVNTLYVISNLKKLSKPYSFDKLIKVSDNKPLSSKYGYSYSLVYKTHIEETYYQPEEIPELGLYTEGTSKKVNVNAFERNPKARAECIKHFGYTCSVCKINFYEEYGDIGKDFIHVHHKKELNKIKKTYVVNPIVDLIPVCPNCHSMLHRKDPAYTIEELIEIIEDHQQINTDAVK